MIFVDYQIIKCCLPEKMHKTIFDLTYNATYLILSNSVLMYIYAIFTILLFLYSTFIALRFIEEAECNNNNVIILGDRCDISLSNAVTLKTIASYSPCLSSS